MSTNRLAAQLDRRQPARARARWTAALFALAGVLFAIYPALRPYSSESGMPGALAFGSDRWVLAHTSGMMAFGCLAAASCTLTAQRLARVSALLGVGLILPYFGAETFGLHAIGIAAVSHVDPSLTGLAADVRNNPVALTMFGAGWIFLAIAGVALGRVLWAGYSHTGAALAAAGFVLYLPQFFGPPWVRIAHGFALGIGLTFVALGVRRKAANG